MAGKHIARRLAALGTMGLGVVLTLMLASCGGGSQSMSISQGSGFFSLSAAQVAMVTQCTQSQDPALPSSSGSNVAPLVVDAGPCAYYPSNNSVGPINAAQDVIYTTVTICPPGLAPPSGSCQTIDHIQVDTGSVGLRILASAMNSSVLQTLPTVSLNGQPINDCYAYADGWTWGVLRTADVYVGGYDATTKVSQGDRAPGISVDIIGDPASGPISTAAQSTCSGGSPSENSVETFGANGILGVMPAQYENGLYYTCTASGGCPVVTIPQSQEANNPVYSLASMDDNGIVVALPGLETLTPPGPQKYVIGTLTFGVTTGGVNGATHFFATDLSSGIPAVQSEIQSESPPQASSAASQPVNAIFDTGTSFLSIYGTGMPYTQDSYQWLIPPSPVTVNLLLQGPIPNAGRNTSGPLVQQYQDMVSVTSEQTLSTQYPYPTYWAFDDLAADSSTPQDIWGAPFFFGKTMYVVYQGSFPQGNPPFYAY